jgi:hypothetical protein
MQTEKPSTILVGMCAGCITRYPLITTIGLGSACQGTPLIRPCRLDDGIPAVDTPDKHHPDPDYALDSLHPMCACYGGRPPTEGFWKMSLA